LKETLDKADFKTVIVGGGIVGAGIFRDLVLNGVEALLLDAGDFSSQTSERSSKMLHGGIRYLENLDFPLIFEALHEKNLWLKLTPHLTREVPFYLPVYKDAKRPLWMIRIGLYLYDALSSFKNSPFSMKSKEETLKDIIGLNPEGLTGAGVYYDGIMDAKITLEVMSTH
jgi:glycerol-3-phosphate dehydrogenase